MNMFCTSDFVILLCKECLKAKQLLLNTEIITVLRYVKNTSVHFVGTAEKICMFSLGSKGLIILRLFVKKKISRTVFTLHMNYLRGSLLAQKASYFSCLMSKRLHGRSSMCKYYTLIRHMPLLNRKSVTVGSFVRDK